MSSIWGSVHPYWGACGVRGESSCFIQRGAAPKRCTVHLPPTRPHSEHEEGAARVVCRHRGRPWSWSSSPRQPLCRPFHPLCCLSLCLSRRRRRHRFLLTAVCLERPASSSITHATPPFSPAPPLPQPPLLPLWPARPPRPFGLESSRCLGRGCCLGRCQPRGSRTQRAQALARAPLAARTTAPGLPARGAAPRTRGISEQRLQG
mmetsp:Transcript_69346/g.119152  ORF Transcript_69346/g.119152 Transcript_69346/m.119152 type:complete len:205 (+) Transcript_69346:126-740(+)